MIGLLVCYPFQMQTETEIKKLYIYKIPSVDIYFNFQITISIYFAEKIFVYSRAMY